MFTSRISAYGDYTPRPIPEQLEGLKASFSKYNEIIAEELSGGLSSNFAVLDGVRPAQGVLEVLKPLINIWKENIEIPTLQYCDDRQLDVVTSTQSLGLVQKVGNTWNDLVRHSNPPSTVCAIPSTRFLTGNEKLYPECTPPCEMLGNCVAALSRHFHLLKEGVLPVGREVSIEIPATSIFRAHAERVAFHTSLCVSPEAVPNMHLNLLYWEREKGAHGSIVAEKLLQFVTNQIRRGVENKLRNTHWSRTEMTSVEVSDASIKADSRQLVEDLVAKGLHLRIKIDRSFEPSTNLYIYNINVPMFSSKRNQHFNINKFDIDDLVTRDKVFVLRYEEPGRVLFYPSKKLRNI